MKRSERERVFLTDVISGTLLPADWQHLRRVSRGSTLRENFGAAQELGRTLDATLFVSGGRVLSDGAGRGDSDSPQCCSCGYPPALSRQVWITDCASTRNALIRPTMGITTDKRLGTSTRFTSTSLETPENNCWRTDDDRRTHGHHCCNRHLQVGRHGLHAGGYTDESQVTGEIGAHSCHEFLESCFAHRQNSKET